MYAKTNTNFILYGKQLASLLQQGLDIVFNYDSCNKSYGKLIIKGIITDLNHPNDITELLENQSLLVETSYVNFVLEDIRLLKSSISTSDNYIDLCFIGNVIREEKLLRDFMENNMEDVKEEKTYNKEELFNLLHEFGRTTYRSDAERLVDFLDIPRSEIGENTNRFSIIIHMKVIQLQVEGRIK